MKCEYTRGWSWWDWLCDSLNCTCCCHSDHGAEDVVQQDPPIGLNTVIEDNLSGVESELVMQGMTHQEIRQKVTKSTMYLNQKRCLKYKQLLEREEHLVRKLGGHLWMLLNQNSEYAVSERQENLHVTGEKGSTGKSALVYNLLAILAIPNSKNTICLHAANTGFGLEAASESAMGLYRAMFINDCSISTLSGAQLKSILEGDDAHWNKKQSSVEGQPVTCFLTSNMPTQAVFRKLIKENKMISTWTLQEYIKVFDPIEGRVGCTVRTEQPIPAVWIKRSQACRYCAARLWIWLIQQYLFFPKRHIQAHELYTDSDQEDGFAEKGKIDPKEVKKLDVIKSRMRDLIYQKVIESDDEEEL